MKEDMLELIIDLYSDPKTRDFAWKLINICHNNFYEMGIEKQENFLKPCPFCGNKPELRVYYNEAMVRYEYVFCPFCEVRTAKYDTKKAAGVWNKRYMGTQYNGYCVWLRTMKWGFDYLCALQTVWQPSD